MKKSGKTFDWDSTNLQKLIDESGSTVAMVAKQAGFTLKQLRDYLAQKTCPSVPALCKLADIFAVPFRLGKALMEICSESDMKIYCSNILKDLRFLKDMICRGHTTFMKRYFQSHVIMC